LKLIEVQFIWKMLATINWLRLFQTFQKVQRVSRQKKINSSVLAKKTKRKRLVCSSV